MRLEETYNIHKNLNSIFPFFKSKKLCKRGIHNFIISKPITGFEPKIYQDCLGGIKTVYIPHTKTILKCLCCGKEEKMDELEEV